MSDPLISASELAAGLPADPGPALLDVRWNLGGPPGSDEYVRGHLAGAHFVDLDRELAGVPGPGRHPLPDTSAFERAMRRCGVFASRPVVVYDAGGGLSAARAWWLLHYFGHADVRVLDGGLAAWIAAGLPLSTAQPVAGKGDFIASPGHMPVLDAAGAARLARSGLLLDARSEQRYRGAEEPIDPIAGHIPGARSLPTTGNLGADGRLLDAEALRRRFADAGAAAATDIGVYCGSGVTAAHQVLALEVAGFPAALYVGSWSDWITDPSRPVAVGPS